MRKTLLLPTAAILFIAMALAGCSHPGTQQNGHTVTDDYGRTIAVPDNPQRIVSTSPAVTEIIFALGAGDLLVGRTDFCSYPPEASAIESIGGISNLNVEKILSLSPDIVISGSMIPKKSTLMMDKMGVPAVCVIEQHHFDGLFDNIDKIGRLIGRTRQADSLNALLRQQMSDLAHLRTDSAKSVYYVVGFGSAGNFTAGGDSFINDIITLAGGKNIAADIQGWNFSLEKLMQADPDYIVIRREDSNAFCHTQPYSNLTAVRTHHVVGIESGTIDLQVPRNIAAVRRLAAVLAQ